MLGVRAGQGEIGAREGIEDELMYVYNTELSVQGEEEEEEKATKFQREKQRSIMILLTLLKPSLDRLNLLSLLIAVVISNRPKRPQCRTFSSKLGKSDKKRKVV